MASRSGRTSTPSALHVDDDRGDAVVLRRVGVGAHGGEAALAVLRAARPHLLPDDAPAAVDTRRAGADAGRVGAGVGLAEELAPHELAGSSVGRHPALDLVRGSVLDQREDDPAGDAVLAVASPGRARTPRRSRAARAPRLRDPTAWASAVARTRCRSVRRAAPSPCRARRVFGHGTASDRGSSSASGGRSMPSSRCVPPSAELGDVARPRHRRRTARRAPWPGAAACGRRVPR